MGTYPIHDNVTEEAAREILRNSFAVVRLDDDLVAHLQESSKEARKFFCEKNDEEKEAYRNLDPEGHLLGFNEPSRAKYLYRVLGDRQSDQPWPNERFAFLSLHISSCLHNLLVRYLDAIIDIACQEPPLRPASGRKTLTRGLTTRNCPLDYFFYHERQHREKNATNLVPNCTPHVDRGMLIIVCLTAVPGLEVISRSNGEVVCPEELFADNVLANEEFRLACIMTGGQLASTISSCCTPCVHRVRDHLEKQRLSISYEVRLSV